MFTKQRKYTALALALMTTSSICYNNIAIAQSANDGADEVEEIIVLAGRREQKLKEVPASVAAISPDDFTEKGMQSIEEALNYTPGIQFTTSGAPGAGNITARGVPQSSATPVFGIYVDDTPLTSNTNFSAGANVFFDGLLMDIERIEVIKGPQGTLYGATSVGGMMRYISRAPALQETRASASLDMHTIAGGDVGKTVSGRVSLPILEDKLGITVAGYNRDFAGYVDYVNAGTGAVIEKNANDGRTYGYTADVLFQATEDIDLRFKYLKQHNTHDLTSQVQLAGKDDDEALWSDYSSINAPGPKSLDFEVMSGTINIQFDGMKLTSTTSRTEYETAAYIDYTAVFAGFADLLSGAAPGTTTAVDFDSSAGAKKDIQEIRLTSDNDSNVEWIGGFYYTKENTHNIQDLVATPTFPMLYANFPSNYREYAFFGDVTYYVSDRVDFTAGARLSKNKVVLNLLTEGPLIGSTDFESATLKDTVKTFLLAGRYRYNDNTNFYTRVATGYRPTQANIPVFDPISGKDLAPPVVKADNAISFEIGVKGNTEDQMFDYDFALWHIRWDDFQARIVANGVGTGGNVEDGLNATGFEGTVGANITENLHISANMSYTDSKIRSDEPTIGALAGDTYPNLPKMKWSVQWQYDLGLDGDWDANFGGGFRQTGGFDTTFSQSTTTAQTVVGDRVIGDLNFNVSHGMISFTAYMTNMFNSRSLQSRSDSIVGATTNSTGYFVQPRTIGLNMKLDF